MRCSRDAKICNRSGCNEGKMEKLEKREVNH